jgi:cell division protein FtsA
MAQKNKNIKNLVVGLDIGTSETIVLVAEMQDMTHLNIIGMGRADCEGLKKGMITSIEKTVQSIQKAIEEAQLMADCKIEEVFVSITGSHLKSLNSPGMATIKDKEIQQSDIDRVIETAKTVNIPPDHDLLQFVTQHFKIDEQEGVLEPLGMSGKRIETSLHIVSGDASAVQNITKCVRRSGVEVASFVIQPWAASLAALSDDEKELGVCLIDFGAGTTDVAIHMNGAIRHTVSIPIGGDHVTADIAAGLRIPNKEAEEIKLLYGSTTNMIKDADQFIEVPSMHDRHTQNVRRIILADIIEARMSETFKVVQREVERSGYATFIPAGYVITGGSAALPGLADFAEHILLAPVRIGIPNYHGSLSEIIQHPRFATPFGLLIEGQAQATKTNPLLADGTSRGLIKTTIQNIQRFFDQVF